MTARYQQHKVWKGQTVGQARCQGMAGEMVHPDQRQTRRSRQPLGAHHARQHAADQARTCGHGNAVDLAKRQARAVQRRFDGQVDLFGMGAGGDFGNDAAESRVQIILSHDNVRQDRAPVGGAADHGSGSVVAGAFQAQYRLLLCHGASGSSLRPHLSPAPRGNNAHAARPADPPARRCPAPCR